MLLCVTDLLCLANS